MKTVGLWIDLRKAVIVSDAGRGVDIEFINSDIDNRRWQLDVWDVPAAVRQAMSVELYEHFYHEVCQRVLDARSIFIFGPGEPKRNLKEHLRGDNYAGNIVGVESAGVMTESEIVERVRVRFEDHPDQQFSGLSRL